MTYTAGDPGHIHAHNVLREHVLAEAARFGVAAPTLAGPFVGNEPDHIGAHNQIAAAIRAIATAGGIDIDHNFSLIGQTFPDTARLGDPGHPADHNLLADAVDLIRASDAYNAATGGTVTERWDGSKMWRTHTFTADGTLTVTKDVGRPFEVFAVASGGQGGAGHIAGIGHSGYPGGGGGGYLLSTTATLGDHSVKVGAPQSGGGQDSSALGLTVGGGGPGGVTGKGGPNPGRPGSVGGTSNGGQGGGGDVGSTSPATPLLTAQGLSTTIGAGGNGSGQDSGGAPGALGNAGIVAIRYEVAPFPPRVSHRMSCAVGG